MYRGSCWRWRSNCDRKRECKDESDEAKSPVAFWVHQGLSAAQDGLVCRYWGDRRIDNGQMSGFVQLVTKAGMVTGIVRAGMDLVLPALRLHFALFRISSASSLLLTYTHLPCPLSWSNSHLNMDFRGPLTSFQARTEPYTLPNSIELDDISQLSGPAPSSLPLPQN